MNEKELQKIIEKLNNLDQLVLPNGATGAVWLEDVIDILKPKEIDLGEMINVWIEHHGSLDLDTDKQTIIDFYNQNKDDE